ncbi:MAG: hypothetical protein HY881_12550 [Deltaproteobacteria bacterium]|nr:hypothetical protein [Deltaproteobacteria bacterium]
MTTETQEIAVKAADVQEMAEKPSADFPIIGIGASAGAVVCDSNNGTNERIKIGSIEGSSQ